MTFWFSSFLPQKRVLYYFLSHCFIRALQNTRNFALNKILICVISHRFNIIKKIFYKKKNPFGGYFFLLGIKPIFRLSKGN